MLLHSRYWHPHLQDLTGGSQDSSDHVTGRHGDTGEDQPRQSGQGRRRAERSKRSMGGSPGAQGLGRNPGGWQSTHCGGNLEAGE
jgi:hypothetical protein